MRESSGILAVRNDQGCVFVANADYTLKPTEQCVEIICSGAAVNITLPDVADAKGNTYTFLLKTAGANDVDLLVPDNALNKTAIEALDMDADDDACALYSDGRRWWVVNDGIA